MIQVVEMHVLEAEVTDRWLHVVCSPVLSEATLPEPGQEVAVWLDEEPQPFVAEVMAEENGKLELIMEAPEWLDGERPLKIFLCFFVSPLARCGHSSFLSCGKNERR